MSSSEQILAEQAHIDRIYRSLDAELAASRERLSKVLARPADDSTGLSERDAETRGLTNRIHALQTAEPNACFGRIDTVDGDRTYIGRTGISDGDERIVIDWRAPAAEPFYAATAKEPLGLARRRNLTITRRRVVQIDDDLLDPDAVSDELVGDGALLRALTASRDGRMHDAVATLQAEQDAIVRAPRAGILVVQGAPGTGKTVVALHRAAYLLYRSPVLLQRGVLVVGPSTRFLDYIGDVLPALGESNVVTSTLASLAGHRESELVPPDPELAILLGDARMAPALRAFIEGLQGNSGPRGTTVMWDGESLCLPRAVIRRCAAAARETREPHNVARRTFQQEILDDLTLVAERADSGRLDAVDEGLDDEVRLVDAWLDNNPDAIAARSSAEELESQTRTNRAHLRSELERDAIVQRSIDALWPRLTPERAVSRFLDDGLDSDAIARFAPDEIRMLRGSFQGSWTDAHVALFDEAADILGGDEPQASTSVTRARQRDLAVAERLLRSTPSLAGWMTAEMVVDRNATAEGLDLADRAKADRTWAYGHVIVDEAQELTPMQWRMIARRCPTMSMTIVGDVAQTSSARSATTWSERLTELGRDHRLVELTICYRSPREIVEAVEPILHDLRPDARRIHAVRTGGERPALIDGSIDDTAEVIRWAQRPREGQRAVITPEPERLQLALQERGVHASGAHDLRESLLVLHPATVKGLEFDHVLVHAPNQIVESDGLPTLYVALTRSTSTLTVVQTGAIDARFVGFLGAEGSP